MGLGGRAGPDARRFSGDRGAGVFVALAGVGALGGAEGDHGRRIGGVLLLMAGLVAGILTKNTVALAIPTLLLVAFDKTNMRRMPLPEIVRRHWLWVVALTVGVFIWVLVFPRVPALAGLTPDYYGLLLRFFFKTPHPHLAQALSGPLISQGKSVFL